MGKYRDMLPEETARALDEAWDDFSAKVATLADVADEMGGAAAEAWDSACSATPVVSLAHATDAGLEMVFETAAAAKESIDGLGEEGVVRVAEAVMAMIDDATGTLHDAAAATLRGLAREGAAGEGGR